MKRPGPVNLIVPAIAAFLAGAAPAAGAPADKGFWAKMSIEFEDEFTFSATDPDAKLIDAFVTVEGDFGFAFRERLGIRGLAVFEPVKDPQGDRFMQDFGLFVEEVYLYAGFDEGSIRVGKFNPQFDLASDLAPGLYGDEIAGDYELTEVIGGAFLLPIDGPGAGLALHASVFMADRTPLSDSLFSSRGRLTRPDGGPSNTDFPQSFALAASAEAESTLWNIGARYRRAHGAGENDEAGFIVGLAHVTELAGLETLLFAEAGHFENFDGEPYSASFATAAFEIALDNMALSAAYGLSESPNRATSHLATLSLALELSDGLTAEAGYRYLDDDGVAAHTLGFLLTYDFALH